VDEQGEKVEPTKKVKASSVKSRCETSMKKMNLVGNNKRTYFLFLFFFFPLLQKMNHLTNKIVFPLDLARLIRGVSYREAIVQLNFCPLKPAKILIGLLNSARANAENQLYLNPERLIVCKKIFWSYFFFLIL
jgi:hypothetical protein